MTSTLCAALEAAQIMTEEFPKFKIVMGIDQKAHFRSCDFGFASKPLTKIEPHRVSTRLNKTLDLCSRNLRLTHGRLTSS